MAWRPYFLKNRSALSRGLPTILRAKGLPNVRESMKHNDAPTSVHTHDSNAPHNGPNTRPFVIVTTFAGSGAMIACAIIKPAETTTAHGPYDNSFVRNWSTPPVAGPTYKSRTSADAIKTEATIPIQRFIFLAPAR